MDVVDWRILADAMEFYRSAGYRIVELPWFQPDEVLMITCPTPERIVAASGIGGLVGSAEQAFVGLDMKGTLGKGRFVACTPCFRNEPTIDRLHRVGFMKVELYRNDFVHDDAVAEMIDLASRFMAGAVGRVPIRRTTDEGFDLEIGGIEVGSYGRRAIPGLSWVYGTGAAEPRLSIAAELADS